MEAAWRPGSGNWQFYFTGFRAFRARRRGASFFQSRHAGLSNSLLIRLLPIDAIVAVLPKLPEIGCENAALTSAEILDLPPLRPDGRHFVKR